MTHNIHRNQIAQSGLHHNKIHDKWSRQRIAPGKPQPVSRTHADNIFSLIGEENMGTFTQGRSASFQPNPSWLYMALMTMLILDNVQGSLRKIKIKIK